MHRLLPVMALFACASTKYIEGKVEDTPDNREIVRAIERYRKGMERVDIAALLSMAHPWYFEDSGTAKGDDDYGYEGLKKVLTARLSQVKSVRYGIRYKKVSASKNRAKVHVFIDASYELASESGVKWQRKVDDNEINLIRDGSGWRFLSGM